MKKSPFNRFIILLYLFAAIFLLPVYAQQTKPKTLFVSVLNSQDEPVINLPQSAFTIFENKEAQTITSFSSVDRAASVGILFDVSPSFADKAYAAINLSRNGLIKFIKTSNPLNEYFIMGFDDKTKLVTDWTSDETEMFNGLTQLPSLTKDCFPECSKIYDAFFPAIEKLSKSRHSKRVLLIVTDTRDIDSKRSQKDLMKFARENDVMIYPVIITRTETQFSNEFFFMGQLSELTGGYSLYGLNIQNNVPETVFNEQNVGYKAILERMASTIKSQYEITYQPTDKGTVKKNHKIKLEMKPPPELKKQIGKFKLYYRSEYSDEK